MSHDVETAGYLQLGEATDAYWIADSRWGHQGITEGPRANQFQQYVGGASENGPNGEVAFRMKWRWPDPSPAGKDPVKGYPSVIYGRKPGLYSSDNRAAGYQPVILPTGSISQVTPAGHTPGTFLPLQLPLPAVYSQARFSHLAVPTGRGQLSYDLWLQQSATQAGSFKSSSITHEIMIQLSNWGGYAAHSNGFDYSHDVTLSGRLWHISVSKTNAPGTPKHKAFQSNFAQGRLDGSFGGRTGWKFIILQPDAPVQGTINVGEIINHLASRSDVYGTRWMAGNEHLVSVELGVEPVAGSGDIVVYDHKVSLGPSAPAPARVPATDTASTPPATSPPRP